MVKAIHTVYMLRCKDGTLYTGYTNDLSHRMKMHESGKGAKYTRGRGPLQIVHTEYYETKEEAMQREYEIKQLSKQQKLLLIQGELQKDGAAE
ncbi:GIY-YIG nuclease family protein [Ornithinibacillus gellani]|uniref:GIY-YIG nuclease family protein n=1 Tax=Ornithinibacillus gellani TaxID=2293253 RepID=UPI000F480588|nr:GIY-YIG nuclease family protein [Ornithinibacillus gellani]TQS75356.1 GIY-YIG nuclease family protein [Ornithinibacillus gellani]